MHNVTTVTPVVSVLLLLKGCLDGLNLVFQLGRFQFLCVFPRHFYVSEQPRTDVIHSVSARTWFSHSSHPSPSTPRPSGTCTCIRRGPLNLERSVECTSVRFRSFLYPRISWLRPCRSRSSSSRSQSGNRCLAAGACGASGYSPFTTF